MADILDPLIYLPESSVFWRLSGCHKLPYSPGCKATLWTKLFNFVMRAQGFSLLLFSECLCHALPPMPFTRHKTEYWFCPKCSFKPASGITIKCKRCLIVIQENLVLTSVFVLQETYAVWEPDGLQNIWTEQTSTELDRGRTSYSTTVCSSMLWSCTHPFCMFSWGHRTT